MERIDPAMAARVWQRVRGEVPGKADSLHTMALQQRQTAAQLRQLARQCGGRTRAALLRLAGQAEENCRRLSCLE